MTDKKKITLIYAGVAVISVMILGMSFFLTTLKKQQEEQAPPVTDVGKAELEVLKLLRNDIELERQDGEEVKISALHDKVWVAAQYYASCPMCATRNAGPLLEVYREFQDEEDFLVACFSVDPANDTPEMLAEVREALDVPKENWWFLQAEQKKLWDYMEKEMGFVRIEERFDPIHIQQKGRWAHDIGLQLYKGTALVYKWNEGEPLEAFKTEVEKALNDLENQPKTIAAAAKPSP